MKWFPQVLNTLSCIFRLASRCDGCGGRPLLRSIPTGFECYCDECLLPRYGVTRAQAIRLWNEAQKFCRDRRKQSE